jgi:TPR repeat protein
MYANGAGAPRDDAKAAAWFRAAADNGDVQARINLGAMLLAGRGVTTDAKQAVRWLGAATDRFGPHPPATYKAALRRYSQPELADKAAR